MGARRTGSAQGASGGRSRGQRDLPDEVVLAVPVLRPFVFLRMAVPMMLVAWLLVGAGVPGLFATLAGIVFASALTVATNRWLDARGSIRIGAWSGQLAATRSELVVVRGTFWTGRPAAVSARSPLSSVHVRPQQFGVLLELPDGERARLSVPGMSFGTARAEAVQQLAGMTGA